MHTVRLHTEGHHNEVVVSFIPPENWWQRARWELVEEYPSHNGEVVVPVGFITDGATIFWALRWLFSPTGKYFPAAIVHDYLIAGEGQGDWCKANDEFEKEMNALSVKNWRKATIISVVKIWTKITGK